MEAVPSIINKGLIAPPTKRFSPSSVGSSRSEKPTSPSCKVVLKNDSYLSMEATASGVDFAVKDWTIKYQEDFEHRFKLPHLVDIFPDNKPMPSTFCLKSR